MTIDTTKEKVYIYGGVSTIVWQWWECRGPKKKRKVTSQKKRKRKATGIKKRKRSVTGHKKKRKVLWRSVTPTSRASPRRAPGFDTSSSFAHGLLREDAQATHPYADPEPGQHRGRPECPVRRWTYGRHITLHYNSSLYIISLNITKHTTM